MQRFLVICVSSLSIKVLVWVGQWVTGQKEITEWMKDVIWDLWMIMVIVPGFGCVTKASQSAFFFFFFGGGSTSLHVQHFHD